MPFPFAAIGLFLSAIGILGSSTAQRAQNRFQARVAKANQKAAEMEADFATDLAHRKEGEHRQKVRRLRASQRAAQASSGFLVGEGTFGDILEDTALVGEFDALAIRHEGALAAHRARERAKAQGAQSQLFTSASRSIAGEISAAGTLLTGLEDQGFFKKG